MSSNIVGVESLLNKIDTIDKLFVSNIIEQAVQRGCITVQSAAKRLCPVDTGELRNSIFTKVEKNKDDIIGKIYTNKEYAPYVEFGTGSRGKATYNGDVDVTYNMAWAGMPAQPYLYPALKNNEEAVIKKIQNDIAKEIRKVTGNAK